MLAFLIWISGACLAWAADLEADLSPSSVSVGQTAQLTVSVNRGGLGEPKIPAVDGLRLQRVGTSQSIQMINGRMNSSVVYTYVVVPQREGEFIVGPITASEGKDTVSAGPFTLKAVPGPQGISAPPQGQEPVAAGEDVFVKAEVSKNRVYVNEPFSYRFSLWQREGSPLRFSEQPNMSWPGFDGFWAEQDVQEWKDRRTQAGQIYELTGLSKVLFPLSAGTFTLDSAKLQASVMNLSGSSRRRPGWDAFGDPFSDDFFNRMGRGQTVVLQTDPLTIEVLDPPAEGRPSGFTGAVGEFFEYSCTVDRSEVQVSEAVTLKAVIRGPMNPKSVVLPGPKVPEGMKMYDPKVETKTQVSPDGEARGEQVVEWILVPDKPGDCEIQPQDFCYLRPSTGSYEVASVSSMRVKVTGSAVPTQDAQTVLSTGVQVLAKDVLYIQTDPGAYRSGHWPFVGSLAYWVFQAGMACLWGGGAILCRLRDSRSGQGEARMRKSALGRARREMGDGAKLVSKDPAKALGLLREVMERYLARKSHRQCGHSLDEMQHWLESHAVPSVHIQDFRRILEGCDVARFSGGSGTRVNAGESFRAGAEILQALDKELQ